MTQQNDQDNIDITDDELNKFLIKKTGMTFADIVTETNVHIEDINEAKIMEKLKDEAVISKIPKEIRHIIAKYIFTNKDNCHLCNKVAFKFWILF